MKLYTLSEQGIVRLRRRQIRFLVLVGVAAFGFSLGIGVVLTRHIGMLQKMWPVLLITLLGFVALFWVNSYRVLSAMQVRWQAFRIEVGDEYIACQHGENSKISVRRQEIVAIRETDSGLVISTAKKSNLLTIPAEIGNEAYTELRAVLSTWMYIEPEPPGLRTRRIVILTVWVLGFFIVLFSWSAWLTLFTCIIMVASYVYATWLRKHLGHRIKLSSAKVLIIPVFMAVIKFTSFLEEYRRFLKNLFGM